MAPIFNMGNGRTAIEVKSHSKNTNKRFSEEQYLHSAKRSKTSHLEAAAPLAEKLRPQTLLQVVGQRHLVGPDSLLMKLLASESAGSMILWGPPGYVVLFPCCGPLHSAKYTYK